MGLPCPILPDSSRLRNPGGNLPYQRRLHSTPTTLRHMERIRTLEREQLIRFSMVAFAMLAILSFCLAHAA
jgi:hypothetical protein